MMARLRRPKIADQADRHYLYQQSVQDTEAEIDFVEETWRKLRDRPAELLREDFCGTLNTACEWVRRDAGHYAIGIDWDREVLDWGRLNNLEQLDDDQFSRIILLQENVLEAQTEPADIVLAMNFSYFLFLERADLLEYFCAVHDALVDDGIFFLDAYGGYDAPKEIIEERECDGFTYIWDQASFNPIDSRMTCHIHFEFPDKSRLEKAFSYHWRLWTLPEIRELLSEAGFADITVYWEGTDEESNEGDGIFTPAEVGDADPGWICYLVAET
ncbi:MAG: class I SAM-dependent methyltransferase [Xanthomonadales bacterium]